MNFNLTDEQQQFTDSLERWLRRNYSFEQRRAMLQQNSASTEQWRALAELGTFALTASEEAGGFDGNAVDVMATMQQTGAHLVVEPILDAYVALELLRNAPGGTELCSGIAAGERRVALALFERDSRYDAAAIALRAEASGGDYLLHGEKTIVLHGAHADTLIVSARTAGEAGERNGITLFAVPANSAGLHHTPYTCVDGFQAADIRFDNVRVPASAALHTPGAAWPLLERALDLATVAVCAEGLGIMQSLNEATVEYLKTRQQFGTHLGRFQALQHRCVEMLMEYRQARVLTMNAAVKMQSNDASERRSAVSAAKARVNRALRFISQEAVHLHGGIGVTDELPVAHYFKRATIISTSWGDLDHHLERFIAQPGFAPEHETTRTGQSATMTA